MGLLYDSTNPNDIPAGVFAAGYVDGIFAWPADSWARFSAVKRIAVFATTDDGDALDVERFDATPDQAPGWVQRRRAAGVLRPWVYCNRSNRPDVEGALTAAGVLADQVALWVATLDGTRTVPAGPYPIAAVQYANAAMSGGHYDLSIVNELFGPGQGSLGGDMIAILRHTSNGAEYVVDAAGKRYIGAAEAAALGQAGAGAAINADAALDQIPDAPDGAAILAAIKAISAGAGGPTPDLTALIQAIKDNTAQLSAQTTELNAISTKLSTLTLKAA
jgi:hypothetical protein